MSSIKSLTNDEPRTMLIGSPSPGDSGGSNSLSSTSSSHPIETTDYSSSSKINDNIHNNGFIPIKNKFIQLPISGSSSSSSGALRPNNFSTTPTPCSNINTPGDIWTPLQPGGGGPGYYVPPKIKPNLYRSNSSLNLVDGKYMLKQSKLKSNYSGSSNSIEIKPNFISLLNSGTKKSLQMNNTSSGVKDTVALASPSSSLKLKMYKLFENKTPGPSGGSSGLNGSSEDDVGGPMFGNTIKINDLILFSHYDTQSILFNLANVCKLKMMLAKRRNTTTGASAASLSMSSPSSSSSSAICEFENDTGDGISNELLLSCPYFRNEIGEPINSPNDPKLSMINPTDVTHSISILEYSTNKTYWNNTQCVLNNCTLIEAVDEGAYYYRNYFFQKEHENWFGTDDLLGPLAISILKEELPEFNDVTQVGEEMSIYRIIVRSSELTTLRGSILEESIKSHQNNNYQTNKVQSKDVLEYILPEIQLSCLKQGKKGPEVEKQLLKLDEQILIKKYKVGIMLCSSGQRTEEDMYNNEYSTEAFEQFLNLIGTRVRLKGWTKYNGGLDVKDDSTGLHSVYTEFNNYEIMFHVSTLLPFTPNNRQQLMRKRHIGNDIVTIIFQEPGSTPFTPKYIRSQFQHVFIIVRVIHPCTNSTKYSISVSRSKEVPKFGPTLQFRHKFNDNYDFINFLLSKVINAENATYRSEKFTTMATRTRQEYLKDLFLNYTTNICIDSKSKFSLLLQPLNLFGNASRTKKDLPKNPNLNSIKYLKGGLCWKIYLNDMKSNYYLSISMDSLIIIDINNKLCVFAIPTKSILGWNEDKNRSINVYYHESESINILAQNELNVNDIQERLKVVSPNGTEGIEYLLKRNINGQFGFHIQDGGIITDIDTKSHLNKSGLLKYSKIVQICNIPVWTLKQDEMINYLKTRNNINIIIIPPLHNGLPRRGCNIQHYLYSREDEYIDYKIIEPNDNNSITTKSIVQSVVPGNHRKRYDLRSLSPPRSSNSSGYGTGSSNKSSDYNFNYGQLNYQATKVPPLRNVPPMSTQSEPSEIYYTNITENNNSLTVLEPPPLPARTTIQSPLKKIPVKSNSNDLIHPLVKINQDLFERRNSYNSHNNRITRSYDHLNRFGVDSKMDGVSINIDEDPNTSKPNTNEETLNNEIVIKGKVTYLTEFPSDLLSGAPGNSNDFVHNLTNSKVENYNSPLKEEQDERLKQLKSAYLKKHLRNQEDVKLRLLTPRRSALQGMYYNDPVPIRRRPTSLQNPTPTELKNDLKNELENTVLLKDNLLKLIIPDADFTKSPENDLKQEGKTVIIPRPNISLCEEEPFEQRIPYENNLEARVTHLENELKSEKLTKEILINKVHTLQEENKRLQQETYTTQESFNQFKEWLLNHC